MDSGEVCKFWRQGRCNRTPCKFLHVDTPEPCKPSNDVVPTRPYYGDAKLCMYWVHGICTFGDRCNYLHSWNVGDSYSLLTTLQGHNHVVTAIALVQAAPWRDCVYTGSKDGHLRIYDCETGQCVYKFNFGEEIDCIIYVWPWIFIALPNNIQVWNLLSDTTMTLYGDFGQVYALALAPGMLCAGTEMDGSISTWICNVRTHIYEPAESLTGHSCPVVTMCLGNDYTQLYSGSMDNSIRVWDLETFQCLQTLTEHTSVVTSVLCSGQFLLSASDKTVKVWTTTASGNLEVTYTHNEEHGVVTLYETRVQSDDNSEAKSILLCSCNDNCVRLYDLPSFTERGKIFSEQVIRAIKVDPNGLLLTGDESGQVRVWIRAEDPSH